MACVGHCAGQCYVNVCATYKSPNGVWDYTLNGEVGGYPPVVVNQCPGNTKAFPTAANQTVYDENIEALRSAVDDERGRRGLGASVWAPSPIIGTEEDPLDPGTAASLIYGQDGTNAAIQQLKDSINAMVPGVVTVNIVDGALVKFSDISHIRTQLDALRSSCICNTDCGGHLVCGCYGDCGCNYCDERLKENIIYL